VSRLKYFFSAVLIFCLLYFLLSSYQVQAKSVSYPKVISNLEAKGIEFKSFNISDRDVYFHQRMLDSAIVEGDFINYQFDRPAQAVLKKKTHWRPGLSKHLPPLGATKEQAEAKAEGDVQFSQLYIISPDSDVFPLEPMPENPCWVVRSEKDGGSLVTIIDALTGEKLGYGIPPPSRGFSMSGPTSVCAGSWHSWYTNAEGWFEDMGYPTKAIRWPTEGELGNYVQDPSTTLFYEIAHGGSYNFANACNSSGYFYTYSSDIEDWMLGREKMPFAFIASCGGMCSTGDNTFSYEFRKGSDQDCATVGYCGMGGPSCDSCWSYSLPWQDTMFNYIYNGDTVKTAFDKALADWPTCGAPNNCMRFSGDENFKIGKIVSGDLNGDGQVNAADIRILLSRYGISDDEADFNSDGFVNGLDFVVILRLIE